MACPMCKGRGTVWDWDFDLSKTIRPCPVCDPVAKQREAARAALAREFGTDAQRRTSIRAAANDPNPGRLLLAMLDEFDEDLANGDVAIRIPGSAQ